MEKERFSNLDKIKSLEDYKLQAEELAKKNLGEYETEKDRRIALGIERDELNTRLQNEIAARINLETDLKKRAELENQQRELREKEENANRLRLEQTQRQEEARRREEQRIAEENRQAEIRRQENIRRKEEADRQAEVLRIAEVNRQNQIKADNKKKALEKLPIYTTQLKRQQDELNKVKSRFDMMNALALDYENYDRDKARLAVLIPRISGIQEKINYWNQYK